MNSLSSLKKPSTETGKECEHEQKTLDHFQEWNEKGDWLTFHHHHYDWWMFPIDEISSRGREFTLPQEFIEELRQNEQFITDLRQGVRWMVKSWGWDIDRREFIPDRSEKQKWSHWPIRLYKAGKSMWLFGQEDYYRSLRKLAEEIRTKGEKLEFYSHTEKGKADVLQRWNEMGKDSK